MAVAMAAMAGGQAVGSIAGAYMARKTAKEAMAQSKEFTEAAINALEKVGIPPIEAQKIALETPELIFQFAPQLEQQFPEMKSKFDEIAIDPRLKEAQITALTGLEERAEMGLTPEEQANIDSLRRGTAQAEKGRQATILQEMEQRGLGGGGAELASRLSSSQAATQRASEESDRLAAMQFQAKQAALSQLAGVSTQMRGQEFGEQATTAQQQDAITRFNTEQQAATQRRNIDRMNISELEKQRLKQQLEQKRVQTQNYEQEYNKRLIQQDYANRLAKAQGIASAYTGAGQQALAGGAMSAQSQAQMYSGLGKAAGAGAGLAYESGAFSGGGGTSDAETVPDYKPLPEGQSYA